MAQLISVEKSKYINQNIDIYSKNKIGQYSKFLNKNPVFVTYYHINKQMSRTDVGTGGIESELGVNSPIRFNKINNFPIYNLPALNPDITFDETGYDIELDLTDITVLPNTIKPNPGDYIVFSFPGIKDILFRVNNIRYNTIQSNDFYQIDLDIKDIGIDIDESRISSQIVETYQTIFENIGTQDKCFIQIEDIDKINALVKVLEELKDFYINAFYNKECNSFVLSNNVYNGNTDNLLYDPYLEFFINNSNIYYENDKESAMVLTQNDILPPNFNYLFSRTLWNAILNHSLDYLSPYIYYYQSLISKRFSPFIIYGYPCNSIKLYLSQTVIDLVTQNPLGVDPYISKQLIDDIMVGVLTSTDYMDEIIFNYLKNIPMEIDKSKLLNYTYDQSIKVFQYLPIIMYIIMKRYDEYFNIESEI